jgi:hypothetical protein
MFKRQFPTLAAWPAEKWLAAPAVLFITVAMIWALAQEAILAYFLR